MSPSEIGRLMSCSALALPACSTVVLGLLLLSGRRPSESWAAGLVQLSLLGSFVGSITGTVLGIRFGPQKWVLGEWFRVGELAFELTLVSDPLSSTMLVLVSGLTLVAARFARPYLHRDPGFPRFYFLVSLFASGMLLVSASGSLAQLFLGWELVGVTSALLVGFFQERRAPTQAGLRVFTTYRLCDVGILLGAALLHEHAGSSSFLLVEGGPAFHQLPVVEGWVGCGIGLCLLLGAAGKSAQLPAGSWLPRAMEGPTPSSALFYGGISIHAGVFLLLRSASLLAASPVATCAVALVGLGTALYAGLVVRAQSDVKSTLAFATMAQVGVLLVEVAAGWYTLAVVHLVGHALLRLFQMLRAPSALWDARAIEAALGVEAGTPRPRHLGRARLLVYRLALERLFLDTALSDWLLRPVLALSRRLERSELRVLAWFDGPRAADAEASVMTAPRSQP